MRQGMRQGFGGATVIVIEVRQRQDYDHEWNGVMAMHGIGP